MKRQPLSSHGHEMMALTFAIHDTDLERNSFRGMASVFNTLIDTWIPTRVLPGAFAKTLQENAKRVKVLYQHDSFNPIGVPIKMEENSDGLLVEGKISLTSLGKDVLILLKDKVLDEMSIGFDPIKFTMVEESIEGMKVIVRHIIELRLWEFSPVTWGANPRAKVQSVNSLPMMIQGLGLTAETQSFLLDMLEMMVKQRPEAEPVELFQLATQRLAELHAGKMLSAKNLAIVKECRDALNVLIDAAEPPKDDDEALTDISESMRELDVLELELTSMVQTTLI